MNKDVLTNLIIPFYSRAVKSQRIITFNTWVIAKKGLSGYFLLHSFLFRGHLFSPEMHCVSKSLICHIYKRAKGRKHSAICRRDI